MATKPNGGRQTAVAADLADEILRDCQIIIAEYLDRSCLSAPETISRLLTILDGPRCREFQAIRERDRTAHQRGETSA